MTKNIKILKLYAKNRRFPGYIFLGNLKKEWLDYSNALCKSLTDTSKKFYEERALTGIKGTELETDYKKITSNYKQKEIINVNIPEPLIKFEYISHLRFALLDENSKIEYHLDDPRYFRFICIIQGSNVFHCEKHESIIMKEGEVWFINGSYRHMIDNCFQIKRIAMLGNFEITDNNRKILNELL